MDHLTKDKKKFYKEYFQDRLEWVFQNHFNLNKVHKNIKKDKFYNYMYALLKEYHEVVYNKATTGWPALDEYETIQALNRMFDDGLMRISPDKNVSKLQ